MRTLVYKFGLRPPTVNADKVREQLRAAHNYRNDLVAIERGRRWALRQIDATPEVAAAAEIVRSLVSVTRSKEGKAAYKEAVASLRAARKAARTAAAEEVERISELDKSLRRDARALTSTFWGTYLGIEAAHIQARATPLYGDNYVAPNDPHFVRWEGEGRLGVQLQGGLSTPDLLKSCDSRARLELGAPDRRGRRYGTLSIRIGSEGREPVWASWPIKTHRAIPDVASIQWIHVSLRREGPREIWSCEITLKDPSPSVRDLDKRLKGTIAVQWAWDQLADESIRVASWVDSRGGRGEVLLPARNAIGIRKPDGIRAVRDMLLNDLKERLQPLLQHAKRIPEWLRKDGNELHLWMSPARFYKMIDRWRRERLDEPRNAYAILDEWWERDSHLYSYEAGARSQAIGRRRDLYRCIAATWGRSYRTVLLSDQDLSWAAKRSPDGDVRVTAGVSELRQYLRNKFGDDAVDTKWNLPAEKGDERPWCERVLGAWEAEGTRGDGIFAELKQKTANAWATRKAKKKERAAA